MFSGWRSYILRDRRKRPCMCSLRDSASLGSKSNIGCP